VLKLEEEDITFILIVLFIFGRVLFSSSSVLSLFKNMVEYNYECGSDSVKAVETVDTGKDLTRDDHIVDISGLKWPSKYIQNIRARDPMRVNPLLLMFETKRCLFCHKDGEFKRIRRSKLHDPFLCGILPSVITWKQENPTVHVHLESLLLSIEHQSSQFESMHNEDFCVLWVHNTSDFIKDHLTLLHNNTPYAEPFYVSTFKTFIRLSSFY